MEIFVCILIGFCLGFFTSIKIQLIVIIIVIAIFLIKGRRIEGLVSLYLISMALFAFIGILIGNSIYYIDNEVLPKFKEQKIILINELPELVCKTDIGVFILNNYESKGDLIINLKTDQAFNKTNCSLNVK